MSNNMIWKGFYTHCIGADMRNFDKGGLKVAKDRNTVSGRQPRIY